jgi:hypothetical protein
MSGYLNSLFNTTANRVASIKQNLLPSENDGDTEDDTHICRVLRGYYTEKGRAFPAWLPPDPRAPPPVVIQPVYSQSNVGRGYGGLSNQAGGPGAGGGALSSLWDSQPQQPPQQDQQSLRQGRGSPASRLGAGGAPQRHNPFSRQQNTQEPQVQARPLPSQRAGSYQTAGASPFSRPDSGGGVALSAKDKLKGQFHQKRSNSPAMSEPVPQGQRNNSYESSGGASYDSRSTAPSGGYGGGGGGDRPFVAATAPWASNESEFTGGGYNAGYDSRAGVGRQGLPAGPGAGRRGQGLPSGPRGPR